MLDGKLSNRARDRIMGYISEKQLKAGERLPSVRKFSQELGISPLTVHRAISSLEAEGILETRTRSGTFLSDSVMSQEASRRIGIIMPNTDHGFIIDLLAGVEAFAGKCGLRAVALFYDLEASTAPVEQEKQLIRDILDLGVAGLALNLVYDDNSNIWDLLNQVDIPVVCVNNLDPNHAFDGVTVNNRQGGILAARHLLDIGRKRIALVLDNEHTFSVVERVEGFVKTLERSGIELPEQRIFRFRDHLASSQKLFESWLKAAFADPLSRPDAVFCINDPLAAKTQSTLINMGLSIPEDVALIGYDNSTLAEHLNPPLTSVSQPTREMGRWAVEILLNAMEGRRGPDMRDEKHLLPELAVRASTVRAANPVAENHV